MSYDCFSPSLSWSYRLALKSKIVPELRNISVVRDFLNISSVVSPGCPLTIMLSSWSSWFLVNQPFSKNLCWIPWASWLSWTTTWRVGRWKLVWLSSFQRDILVCVCWRKMIFSLIVPRDRLLNLSSCPNLDLSVGYRQVKREPTMFIMLSYSWLFPRAYTVISFGSDQCYHLVHIIMEFHLHGNLDDLLLSPSTIFSSYPWFMLNIKLVLETLKAFLHASSWSICLV